MTTENIQPDNVELDFDKIVEERERLDRMFNEKFMKTITVMFTDLKGSTAFSETQGDLAGRTMIKHHNDIVLPAINKGNGILVKTMGDGTMSYFTSAQDAVRVAAQIQSEIDQFNLSKTLQFPILIRIGLHTGKGIVEKNDIFGDVVNVASRFESIANPGEIYLSEETFNSLTDKGEIYCHFLKKTTLKGKAEPVNVYKAFWNPTEIEIDIKGAKSADDNKSEGMQPAVKAFLIIVPIVIVLLIIFKLTNLFNSQPADEIRTKQHRVTIPTETGK